MHRRIIAVLTAAGFFGIAATAAAAPPGADDPARAVPNQVLVGFKAEASARDRERAAARVEAQGRERVASARTDVDLLRLRSGASNARAIDELRNDAAVAYAEPNWRYSTGATSLDPFYTDGSLWGMYGDATSPTNQYGSQAGEAWFGGHTGSKGVYVGVIDEGIQFTHPDLDANVWTNPFDATDGVDNDGNGYKDDIHGWDFANNDNTIYDGGTRGRLDKHGTHVTGTVGAEGNTEGVVGVNWDVTYISGKFLGRNGGTTANAIKAVDYFTGLKTKHGLNIVATNNSWGGGGFSQGLLDAINRGGNAEILFIAAAGNGGSDGVGDNNDTTASYPSNYECTANGSYDCVVAVASITKDGSKSGFSNFGLKTVDLGAPGSGIASTLPFNTYGSYSGTSMATPHVTGGAALYAASHPGASAAEIRNAIMSSTVPTASLDGKTVTGGRLNVSGF
ncbi:MAG: S8 family serine peptidase [Actinomycetota bacterium]|nr:S8 family serine peptidase [Actinomycetota bacterium]